MRELNMRKEDIPEYQERIIKLFENAPWFMPGQMSNMSFNKKYEQDYAHSEMEERAFQFPDRYMLRYLDDGSQFDGKNWCRLSERVL